MNRVKQSGNSILKRHAVSMTLGQPIQYMTLVSALVARSSTGGRHLGLSALRLSAYRSAFICMSLSGCKRISSGRSPHFARIERRAHNESELASHYPDVWRRITARRSFMAEDLGIDLHSDVSPFSNIPAHLPPFVLGPTRAMTMT
jgi:hypothetical protein